MHVNGVSITWMLKPISLSGAHQRSNLLNRPGYAIRDTSKEEFFVKNNSLTKDAPDIPQYLNQHDLQHIFGYGRDKMRRFLNSGLLPVVKIGNNYYISKQQLDDWMTKNAGKELNF